MATEATPLLTNGAKKAPKFTVVVTPPTTSAFSGSSSSLASPASSLTCNPALIVFDEEAATSPMFSYSRIADQLNRYYNDNNLPINNPDDPNAPPVPQLGEDASSLKCKITFALYSSLVVNAFLFVAKSYSAVASHSLTVAASAVDSFLDLLSQLIITVAEYQMKRLDKSKFPAGRARLEPIAIILCACVMGMASLQLIVTSVQTLIMGFSGDESTHPSDFVQFDIWSTASLITTIVTKVLLWWLCSALAEQSPSVGTLAVDHRNDVISNAVAVAAALSTQQWPQAWYMDPIGAILISLYITVNWFSIGQEHVNHLVGKVATPEFIDKLRVLASRHHPSMRVDIIRAYHFGLRYLVEIEVVLPATMTVQQSHDISLSLQQKLELIDDVERAFVHVDYMKRELDEHDPVEVHIQKVRNSVSIPIQPPSTLPPRTPTPR